MKLVRLAACLMALVLVPASLHAAPSDPLPDWREGANKHAIIAFVDAATKPGGPAFVPVADRIATFDMDGTLLVEKPQAVVVAFAQWYLKRVADAHPELKGQPYAAIRSGDTAFLNANPVLVLGAAGAGTTNDDYRRQVELFARTVKQPLHQQPYGQMIYAPMRELVAYLRSKDFKVYVVSGSSQEFAQAIIAAPLGLPWGQVIGAQVVLDYKGGEQFIRTATFRDLGIVGAGKPIVIEQQVGQTPIFSFGNSAGDQEMFAFTAANPHHRTLSLWLDHDDAAREYVYEGGVNPMPGLRKVSMKADFVRPFSDR